MSMKIVLQLIGMFILLAALGIPLTPWAMQFSTTFFQVDALCIYGGLNLVMLGTRARMGKPAASFENYCMCDPIFHIVALTVVLNAVVLMGMDGLLLRPALFATGWLVALVLPYWLATKICKD
ncbi:MAG: hypothetical protein P4L53_08895 [Candidatus Obscuribacterales bacterium]|nr:hypothetical protein [Candidatus Obscuribacterales bacterium]